MDLNSHLTETMIQSTTLAGLVIVPTIETLRKRIPSIDGWIVLVVALGVSCLFAGLLLRPFDLASGLDAGTTALLASLLAVGGDAWVSKIAGRVGSEK